MRRALRAALVGAAAAGLVLAVAAPASAHNFVVSSTPGEGEVLTELPAEWELLTNETLLFNGNTERFGLWARDADGLFYGDGCVEVAGSGMTASPVIGEPGDYTLVYSFISADGHPLTGEIPFEWAPAGVHEPAVGAAEAPFCGVPASDPAEAGGESPDAGAEGGAGIPGDVWWIVVAVAAVAVAVALTVILGRRGRPSRDT